MKSNGALVNTKITKLVTLTILRIPSIYFTRSYQYYSSGAKLYTTLSFLHTFLVSNTNVTYTKHMQWCLLRWFQTPYLILYQQAFVPQGLNRRRPLLESQGLAKTILNSF